MKAARFMFGGICALAVGAVLVVLSITAPKAVAGITVPCNATATPQIGQINALQAAPTCTAVTIVRTATPTFTVTVLPSVTPVPPTQAPATIVATQPPATKTPSGGAGGQGVQPPNTGAGPDGGGSLNLELLLAGAALAIIGSGSVVAAVRKRS